MIYKNWKNFWKISAENVNENIRLGKLITEKDEIECSDLELPILERYDGFLRLMDNEMQNNYMTTRKIVYRNIHLDIYSKIKIGTLVYHNCITSCFKEEFDDDYGGVNIKIIVNKGSPFLEYEDTILLPRGYYKLLEYKDECYTLELIESFTLFHS